MISNHFGPIFRLVPIAALLACGGDEPRASNDPVDTLEAGAPNTSGIEDGSTTDLATSDGGRRGPRDDSGAEDRPIVQDVWASLDMACARVEIAGTTTT